MRGFIIVLLFIPSIISAQKQYIIALEDTVYNLNNKQNYAESQKLLYDFLSKTTIDDEDRYYAYLFLSFTRKRLFDYENTLKFLDNAQSVGIKTPNKAYFIANIRCQKALVYFDIREYAKADSLMHILSNDKYKYLDSEYQSKIIMQEAYLLYMSKSYKDAESKYDKAIELMQFSSSCDLPMIYTKKLELYEAMGDFDKMRKAYNLSLHYADSCKILKYTIYTKEVYASIIFKRNHLDTVVEELDSLRNLYQKQEHLKELEDLEEKYESNLKDIELKSQKKRILFLIVLILAMFVGLIALGYFFWLIRRQRNIIRQQNKVNENLITTISHDIKEPLLGVSLLLKKLSFNDDVFIQQASRSLEEQLKSVNNLLNNLLKLKKLKSLPQKEEQCSVEPVIKQVLTEIESDIRQKNLIINNQINPKTQLPISSDKLYVIIKNLLNNAIKFSHIDSEIQLTDIPQGIALKDFGVGMSVDKMNKLLYQVVKSENGTSNEKGNGLGMYLMGQLVRKSNIRIYFQSQLGEGTEVSIVAKRA